MSKEWTTQELEDNALPQRVIAYLCVKYGGAELPIDGDFDTGLLCATIINMGARLEQYQAAAIDTYFDMENVIDYDLEDIRDSGEYDSPVTDFISKSREILQA